MKKLYPIFLIMLLCFIPACERSERPWHIIQSNIEEFINAEEYCDIIDGDIIYPSNIQNKINSLAKDYLVLNVYSNVLSSCFSIPKHYSDEFNATPLTPQSASHWSANINLKIQELKSEISNFNKAKDYYINSVKNIGLDTVIAEGELRIYKRAFYKLIIKANEFNKTFLNAYAGLYGDVPDVGTFSFSASKAIVFSFSELVDVYITYAFTEFNGLHGNSTPFYSGLNSLKSRLAFNNYYSGSCANWLKAYNDFIIEKALFLQALNYVDLTSPIPNDLKTQTYKSKIDRFVNFNANIFIDKTLSLISY